MSRNGRAPDASTSRTGPVGLRAAPSGRAVVPGVGMTLASSAIRAAADRPRRDADTVAATARQQGVATGTLTRFHATPVTGNGLVIGHGGAPLTQVARGCQILRKILAGSLGR